MGEYDSCAAESSAGPLELAELVTRCPELYRVVTGSAFIGNDLEWLRMHQTSEDSPMSIRDITLEWACFALWGPKSREVLQQITTSDISNAGFPYLQAGTIDINGTAIWAQRVSYVGELGWELYVPPFRVEPVWDAIMAAGASFGMEVGGYKVLDSLRLEKGYRYYTADVTPLETPYEGGLGFCVDLEKPDFIGKAALVKAKAEGLKRKLCTLVLDNEDFTQIYGGEAVYHDGKVITRVRSGGFGYTLKKNILYAYLPLGAVQGRQPRRDRPAGGATGCAGNRYSPFRCQRRAAPGMRQSDCFQCNSVMAVDSHLFMTLLIVDERMFFPCNR